jgi:nucleoside triphosphate pyrophosphatase
MAKRPSPTDKTRLILASASQRRLSLLGQIGIEPDKILAPQIDESRHPGEKPRAMAKRLAREKAAWATEDGFILAGDTIVVAGNAILAKPADEDEAKTMLKRLSGKKHRVITAIALKAPGGEIACRSIVSRITFKRLSTREINDYLKSGEWQGKAGAYAIQGLAGAFIKHLQGSYSAVVGLPLYETAALLEGMGYRWERRA